MSKAAVAASLATAMVICVFVGWAWQIVDPREQVATIAMQRALIEAQAAMLNKMHCP